jgi:uncharacterized protein (TIGR03435 family)
MGPLVLAAFVALAQTATEARFEVASVKPSPPAPSLTGALPRQQGGPGTSDPTRIAYRNIPLAMIVTQAFEVNGADVLGPEWARSADLLGNSDKFDIDATLPTDTSQAQFHAMLRTLLADRFALKVHREKKEVPAYALVVMKNGPKLKESPAAPPGTDAQKVDVRVRGEDGFPVTPPGYSGLFVNVKSGHTRVKFIGYSMEQFAKWTRVNSKRPGVDRTGLTGRYDFYVEYDSAIASRPDANELDRGPDFAVALQSQLGLKLTPDKTEIELLVIDHIERTPSEN